MHVLFQACASGIPQRDEKTAHQREDKTFCMDEVWFRVVLLFLLYLLYARCPSGPLQ
jgi:hypothetical protein